MSLAELTDRVRSAIGADCGVDKTIQFDLGDDGVIVVDGRAKPNAVHNDSLVADLTLRVSAEDFRKILDRELSGRRLVLSGRVKLRGDIRIAMKLDGILKLE